MGDSLPESRRRPLSRAIHGCGRADHESGALQFGFDLNDRTKIVSVELVLLAIGKLVLNKNPTNYFAETETAIYGMLCDNSCGMLHAYDSSGLVLRQQRDGAGQNLIRRNIHPCTVNTLNNGFPKPATQNAGRGYISAPARKIIDATYVRATSPTFLDYWSQPRLFQSMSPTEKPLVINAARFELAKVSSETVRKAVIAQFNRISNDLAKRVRTALGLPAPAPDTSYYHSKTSDVSTYGTPLPTIKTLTVAILANASSHSSLSQAATIATGLKAKGAVLKILGQLGVDATYSTAHAAPFDGIIVADGTDDLFSKKASSATLYPPGRPTEIVRGAFLFAKPIAVVGSAGKVAQRLTKWT